ncbi:hypothetical protein VLK31_20875 [Variovorax sp. H27-G14]|uniref:hypothetical protein n=1 Tax=Variovorax sp. H27-G14 TaxID=3111914 RepID=UPI0038FCD755
MTSPLVHMSKLSTKSILAGGLLCLGLTGCTDSSITAVKKSSVPQSDFTFGEALDDAKGCESTAWSHRDDDNGRSVVEYTCTAEITSAQVDRARADNTHRIKALSKTFDTIWTDALATLAQHKQTVEQGAARDRSEAQARVDDAKARRQYLQQMIDTLSAEHEKASAEQPDGKRAPPYVARRLEADIASTKSAIATSDVLVAAAEKARDNPVAAPSLGANPYKSVAEYEHMTQGMLAWKERYYTAVAEKEATGMKRADEFIARAKGQKLQLKITFQVNKKSPVELRSAKWVSDAQMETAVNSSYVAAVLLDPKRMQQLVDEAVKSRLQLPSNNFEAMETFPIVCGHTVSEGCAPRKDAS